MLIVESQLCGSQCHFVAFVLPRMTYLPLVVFFADPYLNTDAGTMSPFEHGEVFVLDDGGEVTNSSCYIFVPAIFVPHAFYFNCYILLIFILEIILFLLCFALAEDLFLQVDLVLGNYERFLDVKLTCDNSITTGKIYQVPNISMPSLLTGLTIQHL